MSPILYFWDLTVLGLVFIWLLQKPAINKLAAMLLLLFLLSQTVSLINAQNLGAGLVRLEQFLLAGFFGVYLASKRLEQIRKLLYAGLVGAILIEGSLALYQFLLGKTLGLWILGERSFSLSTPSIATFNWYGEVFLRPYGTTPHPNVLAAFMLIACLLVFYLSPVKKSLVTAGVITVGFLTTLLTFSRIGIFLLAVESAFFLKKKFKLLIFLSLVLLPIFYVRFESAFNFDNLSIIRREELAGIAFKLFLENPLLGVGLNNFINSIASSDLISGPSRFLQPVHNIYLLLLSETGVLGLLGFLGLFLKPFKEILLKRDFAPFYIKAFLLILLLGMFDHYLLTLPQGIRMLFLIWGLSNQRK